ncbi:MAG: Carboxylesterase, type [Alphaproteobacteria bacterium]|nr:Carboxylesterase, type [Alphaproteobacteria bacterium]
MTIARMFTPRIWLAALAAMLPVHGPAAAQAPVTTASGALQGESAGGLTVYKGIPFAAPPIGALRWKAPSPPASWKGVRKATAFAPACIQNTDMFAAMGEPRLPTSEDCLYLNVWTPAKAASDRLPVMVWIHGGGFTTGGTGTPMFDGSKLASRGVVVVTIAYRLGALGFLAARELSAESPTRSSGAYGIMDQVAALNWVHRNVAAFGGDPAKVTIFGESAGGMSVSALASSPKTEGLFRGVIAQSGAYFPQPNAAPGAPGSRYTLASAEAEGARFLQTLATGSIAEARAKPADEVLRAAEGGHFRFAPVADDVFLAKDPFAAYAAGRFRDTPVLIGFNSDEGALFVQSMAAGQFKAMVAAQYGAKAPAILAAYPAGSDSEALASARRLFGDSALAWPVWTWAQLQSRHRGRVFAYYFDHKVPHPDAPMFQGVSGAFHGSDLAYVFGVPVPGWQQQDDSISSLMIDYWTSFARTGDPNGAGRPAWPNYTQANPLFLELGPRPHPIPVPNAERLRVFGQ